MSTFKERLKTLIQERNCTYTNIEKETGIKHYTISSYINGNVEPDVDSLIKLSKYFQVSSDYLIGNINTIYPKEINDAFNEFKNTLLIEINNFNNQISLLLKQK